MNRVESRFNLYHTGMVDEVLQWNLGCFGHQFTLWMLT